VTENKNLLIAVVLSVLVLLGWEYFYGMPQRERAQRDAPQHNVTQTAPAAQVQDQGTAPRPDSAPVPATAQQQASSALRVQIDTPRLQGSISTRGARIDQLSLKDYHETVDPKSPQIVLLSPQGSAHPFYVEQGWVAGAGVNAALPDANTVWTVEGNTTLSVNTPVTLVWDNGGGMVFNRTISVDENYLFTVTDRVANNTAQPVALHPYGLISRHGLPHTSGYYILHEGLLGYFGEEGLQEIHYGDLTGDERTRSFAPTSGWLGITDKYWAAALVPPQGEKFTARFTSPQGATPVYQTDYLLEARNIEAGQSTEVVSRVFAGAKEVAVVDNYETAQGIPRFELMIDWGWFYFITKPLFSLLDWFYRLVGNFGVAILIVTVLVKMVFYPLANKSYASMAKMKKVQPEMLRIRERHGDDRVKQQQEMMELYKREKINPVAGCLPVLVQIPVFFALYKVLFITIEMRHAPFFGWIKDLAAPDPTSLFNLFGLIPWDPPTMLIIGIWPLLMGVTMFVQMQMNPAPPDKTQAMIFTWMPVFFTYLLASFPAGLVIYWTWNNFLSILQQGIIMKRHGAKVELFDNLKRMFSRKKPQNQA
jgi:YidC/Oxa1 family membrane protein insertase